MIFTLSPNFAHNIVDGYCKRYQGLHQNAGVVFVPNKLACQQLTTKFALSSASFTPELQLLGEYDASDYQLNLQQSHKLTPISAMRLRLIIIELLQEHYPNTLGNMLEIFTLAANLETLYFQFISDEIDFSRAEEILNLEYQNQNILNYIYLITRLLPAYLKNHNLIDVISYRYLGLNLLSQLWTNTPCSFPVVVAGIYNLSPTIIKFMQTIAQLPYGAILLPHFSHKPGSYQQKLCTVLKIEVTEAWTKTPNIPLKNEELEGARSRSVQTVHERRATYQDFIYQRYTCAHIPLLEYAFNNIEANPTSDSLKLVRCYNEFTTAQFIATNILTHKKIAIITQQQTLMHKLEVFLQKHNISFNAAYLMPQTQTGIFLQLILDLFVYNFSIISVLALFKHPYMLLGVAPGQVHNLIRERETTLYREKLATQTQSIIDIEELFAFLGEKLALTAEFLNRLQQAWLLFYELLHRPYPTEFSLIFQAHLSLAEILATNSQEEICLWPTPEIQKAFSDLGDHIKTYTLSNGNAYKETYLHLLQNQYIPSSPANNNINLYITTLEEAQLLDVDQVIIINCGYDEKRKLPSWLTLRLQNALGLTANSLQYKHELLGNILASPEVIFIHCEHEDNKRQLEPKIFLKFYMLLKQVANINFKLNSTEIAIPLRNEELEGARSRSVDLSEMKSWKARGAEVYKQYMSDEQRTKSSFIRGIQTVHERRATYQDFIYQRYTTSMPATQISLPTNLNTNMIESLMQDPYGFYAKYILQLAPLPSFEPGLNRSFSQLAYNILHQALRIDPLTFRDQVKQLAAQQIMPLNVAHIHKKIWLQKLIQMAEFLEEHLPMPNAQNQARKLWNNVHVTMPLEQNYILESTLDLIIELEDAVHIYALKLRSLPSLNFVKAGLYPKLPLEGLIIASGAFSKVNLAKPIKLFYIKITGNAATSKIMELENSPLLIAEARQGLAALIKNAPQILAALPIAPYYDYGIYNRAYIHLSRFHSRHIYF